MKHAFLAAALLVAASVAFADTTSVLLDLEKMRSMSAEEYAAAVRSAPDVNVRDKDERAYLHIAAELGTPDNIAALVSAGADVNARSSGGWTALHSAANRQTTDHIAALVSAGADLDAHNKLGNTPLHHAAIVGITANITALLNAGADVNARGKDGMTPLHVAATGFPKATNIAVLVNAGADVNARDELGNTPLHRAAGDGTPESITALLEAGASGSAKNNDASILSRVLGLNDGKTPFELANANPRVKGTAAYRALNDAQYK